MRILAINPGSTSTKIAVYEDEKTLLNKDIAHSATELSRFHEVTDQYHFRRQLIIDELRRESIKLDFRAVIGRGGLTKPLEGGVYEINELMLEDTRNAIHKHACDLGCLLAHDIAKDIEGCRSFIADPGVVDELCDEARLTGTPLIRRICIWHALNQKAVARRFARERGVRYEDLNLIVCHLGGGISIAAHAHGRAIDANNALDGEGPFSPSRTGSLPVCDLIRICYSGRFTEEGLLKYLSGESGLIAHLGTSDVRKVEQRIANGDDEARRVLDALIFHTAKAIAAEGAVLCGKIDGMILTGGMARSKYIIPRLKERIAFLAPVAVYPGEDEMGALASNALAVLKGEREAKEYK